MLRTLLYSLLLVCLLAVVSAADLTYIMALKAPVTDKTFAQAKKDVEAAGGKVTYEFRSALKAVLVQLPSEQITTFSTKSYVDFMEEDHSVHLFDVL